MCRAKSCVRDMPTRIHLTGCGKHVQPAAAMPQTEVRLSMHRYQELKARCRRRQTQTCIENTPTRLECTGDLYKRVPQIASRGDYSSGNLAERTGEAHIQTFTVKLTASAAKLWHDDPLLSQYVIKTSKSVQWTTRRRCFWRSRTLWHVFDAWNRLY